MTTPAEIAAALRGQVLVRDVAVLPRDGAGHVAYVVADHDAIEADEQAKYVRRCETMHDQIYAATPEPADASFHHGTWTSSYTGQLIPPDEMREFVDTTVARILALGPRRVLEIGCGTGMLLARIAPHCESYVGIDSSRGALDYVRRRVARDLPQVALVHDGAHGELDHGRFDVVVINSVAQFFPTRRYLFDVIERALRHVSEGAVFFGDIRNLRLLRALHVSIELSRAPRDLEALRRAVELRAARDEELAIDPALFAALPAWYPRIAYVSLELRRGIVHNELTRFRYDAVLHVGPRASHDADRETIEWGGREHARAAIAASRAGVVAITGIPNARVTAAVHAARRLGNVATLAELERELAARPAAIDPEQLATLGDGLGFRTAVTWGRDDDTCDVLLRRDGVPAGAVWSRAPSPPVPDTSWPLRRLIGVRIARELRGALGARLPGDCAIVVVDHLPRTAAGELARDALPPPPVTA